MNVSSLVRDYIKTLPILFFVCALSYFNSLKVPFQFDGVIFIEQNPHIRSFSDYFNAFGFKSLLLRPVLMFTYTVDYLLGHGRAFSFHLTNLTIHFSVGLMIYLILKRTFKISPRLRARKYFFNVPLISALLFVTHPLHTESITYLMSRSASLATLFYSGAFYCFIILLEIKFIENRGTNLKTRMTIFTLLILILMLLGLGSKLIIISLPVIMFLYFLIFFIPKDQNWKDFIRREKTLIFLLALPLASALIYKGFYTKHGLFGLSGISIITFSRWEYFISQIKYLTFFYSKVFFLPFNLNVDPDVHAVQSFWDPNLMCGIVILIFFLLFLRSQRNIVLFGTLWFLFSLAPESSFVPLQDIVAEHRMYLPSVGLLMAIPFLLNRQHMIFFLLFLIGTYSINTANRNKDWQSELSLWQDTVKKSPDKSRPFLNLARAYQLAEQNEFAILNYKKAAERDTGFFEIHHNLGTLYRELGDCNLAVEEFRLALILKPELVESMVELAKCFILMEKYDSAAHWLKKAVVIRPTMESAYRQLGKIHYFHLERKEEGKKYFRRALQINPDNPDNAVLKNLIKH